MINKKKEEKKICGIKTRKDFTVLCPSCLNDSVYYKTHRKGKYLCKECNIYIKKEELIQIPYELLIDRVILLMKGEYYKKLEEFKNEKRTIQQVKQ